jgi:glyoxylase-like metal-dependent hydrolase (beta-lactamase superfamily II)
MRIGDVTVHSLLDGVIPVPPALLYPDVPLSTWHKIPGALNPYGLLDLPFGGFLAADSEGNRVLFDLGGGPAPDLLPNGELPPVRELLPTALEALGCPLDSVTDVVLSHLHIDHVGWASVDDLPTFPQARHHIHALDWEHFVERGADQAVRRKVHPLKELAELWEGDRAQPFPWLRLFHAPGHTPGASVALIESQGQGLALVGDLLHHPAAFEHPDWRCGFDQDPEAAAARRVEWINRLRRAGTPAVGPHFPELVPVVP